MLVIQNNTSSFTFTTPRRHVFMKRRWADAWSFQPYWFPQTYTYASSPNVSEAHLLFDFGVMEQPGLQAGGWVQYSPYDAWPYYCGIATQMSGQPPVIQWIGQMTEDDVTADRYTTASGEQLYTAVGLEHLLERKPIDRSYVLQQGNVSGNPIAIPHVMAFNERYERGGSVRGNRNPVELGGVYPFVDTVGDVKPETWNAKQVILYLLEHFVNHFEDRSVAPIQFALDGQIEALEEIEDVWDFKGRTVWDALKQLIDRRRGLGFVMKVGAEASGTVTLHVFTHVESPVAFGQAQLPANPDQIQVSLPTSDPWDKVVGEISIRYSISAQYSEIEVLGERVLVTGSFSFANLDPDSAGQGNFPGPLEIGWPQGLESQYLAEPEDTARLKQSEDKYSKVFSCFNIVRDWTWMGRNYSTGAQVTAHLTANQDGTISTTRPDTKGWYNFEKRFERFTPFLEQIDYSDRVSPSPGPVIPPGGGGVINTAEHPLEHLPPTAWAIAHVGFPDPTPKWVQLDRANDLVNEGLPGANIRPSDREFAMYVSTSPRHSLAKNVPNLPDWITDGEEAKIDFRSMVITASIFADVRPHVVLKGITNPAYEMKPKLTIEVPDCHYWYFVPGTVIGTSFDGARLKTLNPLNTKARDDTDQLRQYAAFLRWWYSQRRQAIEIPFSMPFQFFLPGQLITDISTAWVREPVNAVVTSVTVDFRMDAAQVRTSYMELDERLITSRRRIKKMGARPNVAPAIANARRVER